MILRKLAWIIAATGIAACSAPPTSVDQSSEELGAQHQIKPRYARFDRLGGLVPDLRRQIPAPRPFDAAPPKMAYNGGPLLAGPKVVAIFWGPNVPNETVTGIPQFFQQATGGAVPYIDGLSEYNVAASANNPAYTIGTVSFVKSYVDTAAPLPPSLSIDNGLIQLELGRLIDTGAVPPNDASTLYMFYFDPTVLGGGSGACTQFCGYHSAFTHNGSAAFYGVHPDQSANGCQLGCDLVNPEPLKSLYSVSAHELAEAITDPEPGSGWYDNNNGEIGDMCTEWDGTSAGFVVQSLWSNESNGCRPKRPSSKTSATLTITPNTPSTPSTGPGQDATVKNGDTATFTVTVTGNATPPLTFETPVLQFSYGLTGTFDPPQLMSSTGTATFTLPIPAKFHGRQVKFKIAATDADGVHYFVQPVLGVVTGKMTLTAVTPGGEPASGGGQVTLTGTNIAYDAVAFICPQVNGAATCDLNTAVPIQGGQYAGGPPTAQQFQVTLPGFPAGPALLGLQNPADPGNPAFIPFVVTPVAAPQQITAMTPDHGPLAGGTRVVLTGTNFGTSPTVFVNKVPLDPFSTFAISSTEIHFFTPRATAAGAVDVVVDDGDGNPATSPVKFTYGTTAAPPAVTGVTPAFGGLAGGTYVTVTGYEFASGATVKFDNLQATVTSLSSAGGPTSIGVKTPPHAAGAVDVVVTNPDGRSSTLTQGFVYTSKAPPTITMLSQTSGLVSGGDSVTITGHDFDTNATVTFGNVPVIPAAGQTETAIMVTSPQGTPPSSLPPIPFSVGVTITNADGQQTTVPFTYQPLQPVDMAQGSVADMSTQIINDTHGLGMSGCSMTAAAAPTASAPLILVALALALAFVRRRRSR
jgi:MYXO-CTERM domain-containing protein